MTRILESTSSGAGRRIAVVVAEFNKDITGNLLHGCLESLERHGVEPEATTVVWVPGAFELPGACDRLAATGRYDALIALGAVVRGDTPHFDYVAGECARGLMNVQLHRSVPVAFGVLTTDDLEQARLRSQVGAGGSAAVPAADRESKRAARSNKGAEAAEVALRMASLYAEIA